MNDAAAHRSFLVHLGYRLTGSTADAEEIAQETLLRYLESKPDESRPLKPWLAQVASRLGIDRLRQRKSRPYLGPWLPALVDTSDEGHDVVDHAPAADAHYDLRESVTMAFMLALEALTPEQRAVLVLRDVFDFSAAAVGDVLSLEPENVRQLHSRARRALENYEQTRCRPDAATQMASKLLLENLFSALLANDAAAAAKILKHDVLALNDGGGKYSAARVPLIGFDRVFQVYQRLATMRVPTTFGLRHCNELWVFETHFEHCRPNEAPLAITGVVPSAQGVGFVFTQLAPEKQPRRLFGTPV